MQTEHAITVPGLTGQQARDYFMRWYQQETNSGAMPFLMRMPGGPLVEAQITGGIQQRVIDARNDIWQMQMVISTSLAANTTAHSTPYGEAWRDVGAWDNAGTWDSPAA